MDQDDDALRHEFHTTNWNNLTTPLVPDQQELAARLLAAVRASSVIEENADRSGADDCIIIWPSRDRVGSTSIFPRLYQALERLRIAEMMVESAERRVLEAEARYKSMSRDVAPPYEN